MRSTPARKVPQKPGSRRRPLRIIVVGSLSFMAVASAFAMRSFIAQPQPAAIREPDPAAVSSIANERNRTLIVVTAPNRNECHRYQLNQVTGAMSDKGTSDCANDAGGGQDSRIEAISRGFRNK
jgi:hypothetical protein